MIIVLSDATILLYKTLLTPYEAMAVLLLPTWVEIQRRNQLRPRLTEQEQYILYEQSAYFTQYDQRFDNTDLPADQLASQLLSLYWSGS
jgi:hypothetical protein